VPLPLPVMIDVLIIARVMKVTLKMMMIAMVMIAMVMIVVVLVMIDGKISYFALKLLNYFWLLLARYWSFVAPQTFQKEKMALQVHTLTKQHTKRGLLELVNASMTLTLTMTLTLSFSLVQNAISILYFAENYLLPVNRSFLFLFLFQLDSFSSREPGISALS
jgi:hypothetical protein